jgi:methionyl-tRNA synthetase
MTKAKYITTTLPYANSTAHIGHAFEFIIADALSRYFKYNGVETFFNLGLDEHGLKIQEAAEKKGITPKEYVDEILYNWLQFIDKFRIDSYDSFYRTSDAEHAPKVQQFWNEALQRGDIYKKKYSGTYCVGCESFKLEKDLEKKYFAGADAAFEDSEIHIHYKLVCPDHPTTELKEIQEENYFFRLSKYRNELQEWFNQNPGFLEPILKSEELKNIIENVEDISISRLKSVVSWGVPVPGDDEQTVYVWFDALLNYIFAAGYYSLRSDRPAFKEGWIDSEVIQICGPDNLKFQAVIFQGLLASAGIKKTDKLLVHGTILDANGRKMSKTLGNVIDPIDQVNKYGVDAVRYYALAGLRTYGNSSWDEKLLVELHNSHLADDFGNLVSRVGHLAGKFLKDYEDDPNIELDYSYVQDDKFCVFFDQQINDVIRPLWESYKISEALDETNKLVKSLNKKFGDEEPWKKGKEGWVTVLEVHYAISKVNELYYPVIPGKVGEVRIALQECVKSKIFPKIEI